MIVSFSDTGQYIHSTSGWNSFLIWLHVPSAVGSRAVWPWTFKSRPNLE